MKFSELAPRVFEGPQGTDLQDFVELHNPELGCCHLGLVNPPSRSRFVSTKASTWVEKLTRGTGRGPAQNLSETFTLSDEGQAALNDGLGASLVISVELRCLGGFFRGVSHGSGSNCRKVQAEHGWCSLPGDVACPSDCAFSLVHITHSAECSRGSAGCHAAKCDDTACSYVARRGVVVPCRRYHAPPSRRQRSTRKCSDASPRGHQISNAPVETPCDSQRATIYTCGVHGRDRKHKE